MSWDPDSWIHKAFNVNVGSIVSEAKSAASSAVDTVSNVAGAAVDDVKSAASAAVDTANTVASSAASEVKATVNAAAETVGTAASAVEKEVVTDVKKAVATGTKAASAVKSTAKDVASSAAALPLQAAVTAPLPVSPAEPGLIEEAEEAVVSGVRAVVRAAPAIEDVTLGAAAVAAAPAIAVGVLAGAAILTWSSDAGAAWDGQTNPDTGRQFTSQEEYDRYKASHGSGQPNPQALDRHDEETYAEGILKEPPRLADGGINCDPIIEAIKGLIKALRERYDAMAEAGGGDVGHRQRYQSVQKMLKRLIELSKANECPIDTSEAEEWSEYPLP